MFYNKTILLPNLHSLYNVLVNNTDMSSRTCYYGNKIAIKHYINESMNIVRIWQTRSLCDYWYDDFNSTRCIGGIDYIISDDHIKIDYIEVNDGENTNMNYDISLDDHEAYELNKSIIYFIKSVAIENQKNKIILDVHENLRVYEKYFKNIGFKITNRKCIDNPYWVEAEINLL